MMQVKISQDPKEVPQNKSVQKKTVLRGFSFFSFPHNDLLLKRCKLISEHRYHGVELVVRDEGILRLDSSASELKSLKNSINNMDLEIPSVGGDQFWKYNLISIYKEERELAFQNVVRSLEIARDLDAGTLLLIPGWVGSPLDSSSERIPYSTAYNLLEEQLYRIAPVAESLGVVVAIENVWNKFLLSPLEVCSLLDRIGSSYIKAYFDTGNILPFGYPDDWIRTLGHRIAQIHMCDYRTQQSGLGGFVELFSGDLDVPSLVSALRDISYCGYFMVEVFPSNPQYPEQSIMSHSTHLDLFERILLGEIV